MAGESKEIMRYGHDENGDMITDNQGETVVNELDNVRKKIAELESENVFSNLAGSFETAANTMGTAISEKMLSPLSVVETTVTNIVDKMNGIGIPFENKIGFTGKDELTRHEGDSAGLKAAESVIETIGSTEGAPGKIVGLLMRTLFKYVSKTLEENEYEIEGAYNSKNGMDLQKKIISERKNGAPLQGHFNNKIYEGQNLLNLLAGENGLENYHEAVEAGNGKIFFANDPNTLLWESRGLHKLGEGIAYKNGTVYAPKEVQDREGFKEFRKEVEKGQFGSAAFVASLYEGLGGNSYFYDGYSNKIAKDDLLNLTGLDFGTLGLWSAGDIYNKTGMILEETSSDSVPSNFFEADEHGYWGNMDKYRMEQGYIPAEEGRENPEASEASKWNEKTAIAEPKMKITEGAEMEPLGDAFSDIIREGIIKTAKEVPGEIKKNLSEGLPNVSSILPGQMQQSIAGGGPYTAEITANVTLTGPGAAYLNGQGTGGEDEGRGGGKMGAANAAMAYGGIINRHSLVEVGEGDNREYIIPITKPKRALELINQALGELQEPLNTAYGNMNAFSALPGISTGGGNHIRTINLNSSNYINATQPIVAAQQVVNKQAALLSRYQ